MHVADELRHEDVDVLTEQLMRGVTNDFSDFPVAVLDDTDVATLSRDDDDGRYGVVTILFLLDLAVQFATLCHSALHCLNGLLIALVRLVVVDDDLHEVGVEHQWVDIAGVYGSQALKTILYFV